MKKTVQCSDSLSVEFIDGDITRVEKVGGSSLYTTIYTDDSFVKLSGDVPCQTGWKLRAAIIHYKFQTEPALFWYEIEDQPRVFPGKKKADPLDEFLDRHYGEFFHCNVRRGLFSTKSGYSLKKKWLEMYDMLAKLADMKTSEVNFGNSQ